MPHLKTTDRDEKKEKNPRKYLHTQTLNNHTSMITNAGSVNLTSALSATKEREDIVDHNFLNLHQRSDVKKELLLADFCNLTVSIYPELLLLLCTCKPFLPSLYYFQQSLYAFSNVSSPIVSVPKLNSICAKLPPISHFIL